MEKPEVEKKRPPNSPADYQLVTKKRHLSASNPYNYHHPLFDNVEIAAEDASLPTIHMLNDDCLELILSHEFGIIDIFGLSRVCRRWYNICLSIISRINIFSSNYICGRSQISMKEVMSILSINCGSLTCLKLTDIDGLTPDNMAILGDMLQNLKELDLSEHFMSIDHENLSKVIGEKMCPNLESLALSISFVSINENLASILKYCTKLNYLSITHDMASRHRFEYDIDGSCIPKILSTCNPLTSFSCKDFMKLQPFVLEFVLREFSGTLEYLNISSTNIQCLNVVTDSLPKLEKMKIFLAGCYMWSDHKKAKISSPSLYIRQLAAVLKLMPNLKVLDLSYNRYLTTEGVDVIRVLSDYCPLLEELNLSNCRVPAQHLVNLKKLSVLKRICLDNSSINIIANFKCIVFKVLPHLKELEYLSIETDNAGTIENSGVELEADDIVSFIGNASPKFKYLYIEANLVPWRFSSSPRKRNLIEEVAMKCHSISREGLIRIRVVNLAILHKMSCIETEPSWLIGQRCACQLDDLLQSDNPLQTEVSLSRSYYNKLAPKFIRFFGDDYSCYDVDHYEEVCVSSSECGSINKENNVYDVKLPCFTHP